MLIDRFDLKILEQLQRDDTLSIAQLAEGIGLSVTPCWRRIQRLEKEGVIEKRIAVLSPEKLELSLTVFVMVKRINITKLGLTHFRKPLRNFLKS